MADIVRLSASLQIFTTVNRALSLQPVIKQTSPQSLAWRGLEMLCSLMATLTQAFMMDAV
jgi:hypothetical protein